ncbi:MAG: branched-chain amino acid ABC transporter permease [Firmicutes bacterium]|nr:branched-chain amino acid ABC transporter permease [Bacillota bacterium]
MTLDMFLQHLTNAVSLGALYALVAIGYTMVYGILRLINFAHGTIFTIGAYAAFMGIAIFNLQWGITYILAICFTAVLGMATEKVAYKPLRDAPRISVLISAIGVSFLMENLLIIFFGGRPKPFFRPPIFTQVLEIGAIMIPVLSFAIIIVSAILLVALTYLLYRTKPGTAMRALANDFETARLMAIDVDKTVALTFMVGSSLAAVGGILWALKFPQINPTMGGFPGLKAFVAAVLGGIGSIPGATVGGLILGLCEIMLVAFLPNLSGYRDAVAFVALITVLLLKPTGLLGEKGQVKV